MPTVQKTWLVTGSSAGLGLAISIAALKAGHRVIASARNPQKAAKDHPEVEDLGGKWLQLDVTKRDTQQVVSKVVEEEGGLDVVVNNAGIALQGPIEDLNEDEMQEQMDATFWGSTRVTKGVLPSMRSRSTGTIVNMSSILGFMSMGECSMYCAAKFALEGFSEGLARSLEGTGIRVVILEPGVFRTNIAKASIFPAGGLSEYNKEKMKGWFDFIDASAKDPSLQHGDPEKLAQRTVEIVDGTGMAGALQGKALRLVLGSDAIGAWGEKLEGLKENFTAVQDIARSTDFDKT